MVLELGNNGFYDSTLRFRSKVISASKLETYGFKAWDIGFRSQEVSFTNLGIYRVGARNQRLQSFYFGS